MATGAAAPDGDDRDEDLMILPLSRMMFSLHKQEVPFPMIK